MDIEIVLIREALAFVSQNELSSSIIRMNFDGTPNRNRQILICRDMDIGILQYSILYFPVITLDPPQTPPEMAAAIALHVSFVYPPTSDDIREMASKDFLPMENEYKYYSPLYLCAQQGLPFMIEVLRILGIDESSFGSFSHLLTSDIVMDLLWLFYIYDPIYEIKIGEASPYIIMGSSFHTSDPVWNFYSQYVIKDPKFSLNAYMRGPPDKLKFIQELHPMTLLTFNGVINIKKMIQKPPSICVLNQPKYEPQQITSYLTLDNFYDFIKNLGYYNWKLDPNTLPHKISDFFKKIGGYHHDVLQRSRIFSIPKLSDKMILKLNSSQIYEMVSHMSDYELFAWYELYQFNNRLDILQSFWNNHWRKNNWYINFFRHMTNGDSIGITSGEKYKDTLKYTEFLDPVRRVPLIKQNEDIIFSYGRPGNYRSWPMSDLLESIRPIEGTTNSFQFYVPDYNPNITILGESAKYKTSTFPRNRVVKLYRFFSKLGVAIRNPEFNIFRNKINLMLRNVDEYSLEKSKEIKDKFYALNEGQKEQFKSFLAFLIFLLAWIRFWKGPGFSIPYKWKSGMAIRGKDSDNMATNDERDDFIVIEGDWLANFLNVLEEPLNSLIKNLPLVKIVMGNFYVAHPDRQDDIQVRSIKLVDNLALVFSQSLCALQSSDMLISIIQWIKKSCDLDTDSIVEKYSRMRYGRVARIIPEKFELSRHIQVDVQYQGDIHSIHNNLLTEAVDSSDSDDERGPGLDNIPGSSYQELNFIGQEPEVRGGVVRLLTYENQSFNIDIRPLNPILSEDERIDFNNNVNVVLNFIKERLMDFPIVDKTTINTIIRQNDFNIRNIHHLNIVSLTQINNLPPTASTSTNATYFNKTLVRCYTDGKLPGPIEISVEYQRPNIGGSLDNPDRDAENVIKYIIERLKNRSKDIGIMMLNGWIQNETREINSYYHDHPFITKINLKLQQSVYRRRGQI